MPSPSSTKASDKQTACRKLTSLLQKDYGRNVPTVSLPVLETMLFAACLEDNSWSAAQDGYDNLMRSYYDLNEVRVSSVREIEETLSNLNGADWKGLRIRSILRFVFESTYSFEYEKLKRLTQDSAQKRLKKIDHISPFIRNFTLQHSLGAFLLCLDNASTRAAIRLGIVPPGLDEEAAGDYLKHGLKKADTVSFAYYLRCLAVDPKYAGRFDDPPDDDQEFDVSLVELRFQELKKPPVKKKPKKTVAEKKPAPKKAARAAGKKTSSKATSSKTTPPQKKASKQKVSTTRRVKKPTEKVQVKKKPAARKTSKTTPTRKKVARKRK